jgi:type I restriction enzyme, S subunit
MVLLRDVVEPRTGTRNPSIAPEDAFSYVDVAAIDNEEKRIAGARLLRGSEAPSRARKLVRNDDVLVSTIRPNLNAVALVPPELDGQVASTGFCVLRAKDCVLPEFLYFYTRSKAFVDGLCKLVAGAMYPAVTDAQVLEQPLPLPSLPEQRGIVDLLARAEGIVRLRREAQQKAAELIPAIFIDMFGDLATNPRGWPVVSMAELVSEFRYGTSQKSGPVGVPVLRIPNVVGGAMDLAEVKLVVLNQSEHERLRLVDGDLLFVRTNGNPDFVGRCSVYDSKVLSAAGLDGGNCVYASYLIRARLVSSRVSPDYLQAYLSGHRGRQLMRERAKTSAGQFNLNIDGLASLPIPVAPRELQNNFALRVQNVESILKQHDEALGKAAATFDALLSRAFH